MAQQQQPGQQQPPQAQGSGPLESPYRGPYTGIDFSAPEFMIPPSACRSAKNILIRNNELRSRPNSAAIIPGPTDGTPIRALNTFIDSNNVPHTVCITSRGVYQLNSNWRSRNATQAWNFVSINGAGDVPWVTVRFVNKLFFTGFGAHNLSSWDGIAPDFAQCAVLADGTHIGAGFLIELNSHLIMMATLETKNGVSSFFGQRTRWSVSGETTVWDPTVNTGAGFNDSIDVPDMITGALTIGRTGFMFRSNGITELIPTGNALLPFDFNHLWASDRGIGNVFPQTIAGFGSYGFFVSSDEAYMMTLTSFENIAKGAMDPLYDDLNTAVEVFGTVVPYYQSNRIQLEYWLEMQMPDNTGRVWKFNVRDKHWTLDIYEDGYPTEQAFYALTR